MSTSLLAQPLSTQLRERTAAVHNTTEHSGFMTRLLGGSASADAYAALASQLYFVYDALENAVRRHSDGEFAGRIYDQRLERHDALTADLAQLLGEDWRDKITALPATKEYVARLGEVDELGVVAHHYVRYLGDIAGGQVIATMMRRHYGITDEALHFYDFSELGKLKVYRDGYRAALDALALSPEQVEAVVAEAVVAFERNAALFADLAAATGGEGSN